MTTNREKLAKMTNEELTFVDADCEVVMDKYINQIINADCLDILKDLPDKCIDLLCTDPPRML